MKLHKTYVPKYNFAEGPILRDNVVLAAQSNAGVYMLSYHSN